MMQSSNAMSENCFGDAAAGAQEQAVAELEDVRLVDAGDALAALAAGRFEREPGDPLGRRLGDDAQAFDDAGHDFVLQAAVEAFGVFADDDQVDVFVARRHAGHRSGRPVVGVELQLLPQLDVDAAEAGAAGRGGGAFERGVGAADRGERLGGQRRCRAASSADCPARCASHLMSSAGRVDDALRRGGHFRADAVAGDENDAIGHWIRRSSDRRIASCKVRIETLSRQLQICNCMQFAFSTQSLAQCAAKKRGPAPAMREPGSVSCFENRASLTQLKSSSALDSEAGGGRLRRPAGQLRLNHLAG